MREGIMTTILIVEDDPDNAVLACAVMKKAGYHTLTAVDGHSALESVRAWRPSCVLLDVSIAGPLDGHDVCRALRAEPEPELAATPVLMLSGWAFDSDIEAGKAAGADAYLAKPFRPAELTDLVARLVTRTPEQQAESDGGVTAAPNKAGGALKTAEAGRSRS